MGPVQLSHKMGPVVGDGTCTGLVACNGTCTGPVVGGGACTCPVVGDGTFTGPVVVGDATCTGPGVRHHSRLVRCDILPNHVGYNSHFLKQTCGCFALTKKRCLISSCL